jgi:hypothetical protein
LHVDSLILTQRVSMLLRYNRAGDLINHDNEPDTVAGIR